MIPTRLGLGSDPQPKPSDDAPSGPTPVALPSEAAGLTKEDDRTLVSRIARQDATALASLYDQHVDAIYSLSIRIVGESSEAEAVVQEVFARVWSETTRLLADGTATARLLLGLTRELAIEQARAAGGTRTTDADGLGGAATIRLPQPALGLNDDPADPAGAPRLRDRLASLPLLTRLSIELAYFDGLTLAQIARRLEQPEETVHERIRSGLSELRAAIEESDR